MQDPRIDPAHYRYARTHQQLNGRTSPLDKQEESDLKKQQASALVEMVEVRDPHNEITPNKQQACDLPPPTEPRQLAAGEFYPPHVTRTNPSLTPEQIQKIRQTLRQQDEDNSGVESDGEQAHLVPITVESQEPTPEVSYHQNVIQQGPYSITVPNTDAQTGIVTIRKCYKALSWKECFFDCFCGEEEDTVSEKKHLTELLATYTALYEIHEITCRGISSSELSIILQHCKNLKSIDFATSPYGIMDDRCLILLKEHSPNIKRMNLNHANVSRGRLAKLTFNFKELTWLSLHSQYELINEDLNDLALYGNKLEYLDLSKCSNVTKRSIITVIRTCKKLKHLKVPSCQFLSYGEEVTDIAQTAGMSHDLRSLDLSELILPKHYLIKLVEFFPLGITLTVRSPIPAQEQTKEEQELILKEIAKEKNVTLIFAPKRFS